MVSGENKLSLRGQAEITKPFALFTRPEKVQFWEVTPSSDCSQQVYNTSFH